MGTITIEFSVERGAGKTKLSCYLEDLLKAKGFEVKVKAEIDGSNSDTLQIEVDPLQISEAYYTLKTGEVR